MKSRLCLTALLLLAFGGPAAAQLVMATVDVGNGPLAVVYDSVHNKVFAALEGANQVAVIDPDENEVTATIPVGTHPSALAWSPTSGRLYVGNNVLAGSGTVSCINTADNSVVAELNVGTGPTAMTWNSTRNKVYVMNRDAASVSVIDCTVDDIVATIGLSQTLNAIVYNPVNDRVYVSSGAFQQPGKVFIIDCANDVSLGSFNSGTNAGAMAVNPVKNRLYIANIGSSNLSVMNCANHTSLGLLRTANEPHAVIWTTDNRVFVTSYWGSKVHVLDGDSLRFYRETSVEGNPEAMLYNPHTQKLFITKPLQSQVTVLDARPGHEWRVIDDINVGGGPKAAALYPAEDQVYVANAWGRTVTVIKDVVGLEENPARLDPVPVAARLEPNPVAAGAGLALRANGFSPTRVELWDATGQLVRTAGTPALTAPASPGVYFYRVAGAGRLLTGKLVVE